MSANYYLDKDTSILLIVDMQEKLMKVMSQSERVFANTRLLLTISEQLDIPIIVTEQYPKGLGNTSVEIRAHLPKHQYIEKMEFSAFPRLKDMLAASGRRTVLITGSETHVCVFQTTRDLVAAGYNVHVIKDAVCSRFKDNHSNGLDLMRGVGAVISNTETVLFDLMKVSGTPVFKIMSPLVK